MSTIAEPVSQAKPSRHLAPSWKSLISLWPYLRRYKPGLFAGILTLIFGGLVGALLPLAIGTIVDALSGSRALLNRLSILPKPIYHSLVAFYRPLNKETVVIYCVALLVIVAFKGLFSFLTRWILIGVSRDIEYDIRNDLLAKLVELEPEFYVRNRTGELMSRCTNDLNSVRMVLGPGIMYSITTIVTIVAAVAIMLRISTRLTWLVFLPVPVVAFTVRYFGQIIHLLYEKIQATLALLSARVQENLAGVRVVRAYAQEQAELEAFGSLNEQYVRRNLDLIKPWSMFYPSLQALIGTTFLIVLWQGGMLVLRGRLSIGGLMAFWAYMGQLVWPMVALGWVTNILQRGAASMERLNYILAAKVRIDDSFVPSAASLARGTDGHPAAREPEIRGEIEFRNLSFSYTTAGNGASSQPALCDIHLHIPAGSTVAIVGPTGSGKSTLAALIARLWEAPPGTLLLDGRPICEWPLAELRRAIGFVPQESFLFSDTIGENIAFGVESASSDSIEEVAEVASLREDIEGFPKKFETIVGERGITLSGGQKQRTALARAVLRNPKILVLDDALSGVDTETEEKILERLKEVMRARTTILISHRCSTVKAADQILVLRDRRIVERGTHDELLELGGYYAELYQKQLLEEELERA